MSEAPAAVKDSGKREEMPTGSVRDSRKNKGRYDLLPVHAIMQLAKLFEKGAEKYSANNWRKGQPLSRYLDSMMRHAFMFQGGKKDENHLAAVLWNAACLIETRELITRGLLPKDLDDLPPIVFTDEEQA